MARMSLDAYWSQQLDQKYGKGNWAWSQPKGVTYNGTDYQTAWYNGGNATTVGSTLGSFWNEISGTTQNNVFNSAEAAKQREWETQMSNTAYQRQVADMKAAGINPAAAHMTDGGAPVPNGSSAHSASPGNGGLIGLIASIAGPVLGKVVGAKMMAKAASARDAAHAAETVTRESMRAEAAMKVAQERASSAKALEAYKKELGHNSYYQDRKEKREAKRRHYDDEPLVSDAEVKRMISDLYKKK